MQLGLSFTIFIPCSSSNSFSCRLSLLQAKPNWPNWLLLWIGRTDIIASRSPSALLADLRASAESSSSSSSGTSRKSPTSSSTFSTAFDEEDGLKMVERLCAWRFSEDERLVEVIILFKFIANVIIIFYIM